MARPLAPLLLLLAPPSATARRSEVARHGGREEAPLLHFQIYRAGQGEWPAENSDWQRSMNFANAAGVLRYIHNEVVGVNVAGTARAPTCERKYNIDRIYRYTVSMRSTPEAVAVFPYGFLGFVAMDKGQCTVPDCDGIWWKPYGYVPGCQAQDVNAFHYADAVWYSFPGRCPGLSREQRCEGSVEKEDPGGACRPLGNYSEPEGTKDCTYFYEPDGYVTLDELTGLDKSGGYKAFCTGGGVEFNGPNDDDEGVTMDFWKGYKDLERNKFRVGALLAAFEKKYPSKPLLDDPPCNKPWTRPDYWPGMPNFGKMPPEPEEAWATAQEHEGKEEPEPKKPEEEPKKPEHEQPKKQEPKKEEPGPKKLQAKPQAPEETPEGTTTTTTSSAGRPSLGAAVALLAVFFAKRQQ